MGEKKSTQSKCNSVVDKLVAVPDGAGTRDTESVKRTIRAPAIPVP